MFWFLNFATHGISVDIYHFMNSFVYDQVRQIYDTCIKDFELDSLFCHNTEHDLVTFLLLKHHYVFLIMFALFSSTSVALIASTGKNIFIKC